MALRLTEAEYRRLMGLPATETPHAPRPGATPQAILTHHAQARWGTLVVPDYRGAVPGRKYEIDLALPSMRLGIEVDGWQNHGKGKAAWHRDLEKDRLLLHNGWLVLRVSARDARERPQVCLDWLEQAGKRWGLWQDLGRGDQPG